MDDETKERLKSWLVGVPCASVDYYGGMPSLRFDRFLLSIGASWRVTHNSEMIAASGLDDPTKPNLQGHIVGRAITGLQIHGYFHDLLLDFDGDFLLETFADAATYESWTVTGGPDAMIIAGPGSSWSAF